MNMKDPRKNVLYLLGILLSGMLVAVAIFAVSSASAASISTEKSSLDNLENPYDLTVYQPSWTRDVIPLERSSMIELAFTCVYHLE